MKPFPLDHGGPAPGRGQDADRILADAGWWRAGGWQKWIGWAAEVRPDGAQVPEFQFREWVIHLPLTGADDPLVTRIYRDGAYEISFPDGARCTALTAA